MNKMKVLFLTMVNMAQEKSRGIYADLMKKFLQESHEVYVMCPYERCTGKKTQLFKRDNMHFLGVKTMNLQKTNVVEKGIGQLSLEFLFKRAYRKYLKDIKYDLILYSTPPITFTKAIRYIKKKNPGAMSYLLLKDIFPQNAVDLGMLSKGGLKGILYRSFRKKEKETYRLSDYIGCMSPANVNYLLEQNPEIDMKRVEVAPNSIELCKEEINKSQLDLKKKVEKDYIRLKYNLPRNKTIFIYGGNLGKPQGIAFLIECLDANKNREDCYFVIIGNGTEYHKLETWYNQYHPTNISVMQGLPKEDYDMLVLSCDVGLIFLDHRFTIPNYPSRLLSYMENRMPILCATDPNTDIGTIAEKNGYGYWCESNDVNAFTALVDKMLHSDIKGMGEKAYQFLCDNYTVEHTYNTIMKHINV